jgi:hypothetical protein
MIFPFAVVAQTEFNGRLVSVTISDSYSSNTPPNVDFSYTKDLDTFHFDASNSADTDGNINDYIWKFNDGTIKNGISVSYTSGNNSTFTVSLKIIDNQGAVSIKQQLISTTNSVTDNFERPNGTLGSNWKVHGVSTPIIVDNIVQSAPQGYAYANWATTSFTDNQFAQITLTNSGADRIGVTCRADLNGNGYIAYCPSNTRCQLQKLSNHSLIYFDGSNGISVPDISGKTVKISCTGSTITGYINDDPFDSRSDTTYQSGSIGFSVYNSWTKGIDKFEGGEL